MTRSEQKLSLDTVMEAEAGRLRELIEDYFPGVPVPENRAARMRYVMTSGGKLLRPILSVLVYRSVGGKGDSIYHFALTWEILHNFSLVHDDLPIMDDDDYRRGKPTLHKMYDMKAAALTGVDLLNYCFEVIVGLFNRFRLSDTLAGSVIATITEAAGFEGMVGGQMMDLYWEGREFSPEIVASIHRRKTGGMIEGPVRMGAILGGAEEGKIEAFGDFGLHLGIAYQIADDLLDDRSNFQEMGKATRRDSELKKATYLAISGVKETENRLVNEIERARDALYRTGTGDILLDELLDFILERGTGVRVNRKKSALDGMTSSDKYN
jgi:geranylgeranyl diphosphate synthase type II